MKKFRFPLQKILNIKSAEEKLLQKKLSMQLAGLRTAEQSKQITLSNIQTTWQEKSEHTSHGRTSSSQVQAYYNYLRSLESQLVLNEKEIINYQRAVHKAREILVAKTQEKKTLERLKEGKFAAFKKSYKILEQKTQDEISSIGNFYPQGASI